MVRPHRHEHTRRAGAGDARPARGHFHKEIGKISPQHPGALAIVAGATGMLGGLTLALTRSGWHVAAIARDGDRLATLAAAAANAGGRVEPCPLDLRDPAAVHLRLSELSLPAALTVAWLHEDAEGAIAPLASATRGRFIHVRGIAAMDPAKQASS